MSKTVIDKCTNEGGRMTMHSVAFEAPLNCLAINRDCTQAVVAGRNVFKVLAITEDKFTEKLNLRVGRNPGLNFSAADVTWNPVEDHLLASAATNGHVVTWNLNRSNRNKQEHVFTDHRRSVVRVVYHAHEHYLLLSGSLDGTMKLFDLRKKEAATTFKSNITDGVRDVQFNPHTQSYFNFAAALENGNVQIWDLRHANKWERQFMAHTGPIFCLDWHPEQNWLATGGRDKLIKVWDIQHSVTARNTHTVQTIAGVARIKWRPQRHFHIASCSQLLDFNINVWDIRRPYIPFAAFNEHKDVVTGIVWKLKDPHIFFTSSKDAMLYQHLFRDATRPADHANPVGLAFNPSGTVLHATSDKLHNQAMQGNSYSQTRFPSFFRKGPDRSEQFTKVTSVLSEYKIDHEDLDMDGFVECAKQYQLTGRPFEELCEHNADIALQHDKFQVAQTWRVLKMLYGETVTVTSNKPVTGSKTEHGHKETDLEKVKSVHERKSSMDIRATENESREKGTQDASSDESDEDSEAVEDESGSLSINLTTIASGAGKTSHSDFFFGDCDLDQPDYKIETLPNMVHDQEWSLPSEAIHQRHDLGEDKTGYQNLGQGTATGDSPSSACESEPSVTSHSHHHQRHMEQEILQGMLSTQAFVAALPQWQFSDLVVDMLCHYADIGDVQTSSSMLIVLGDKIRSHIDETTQEQWLMSYIEVLGRFKLWCIATNVIKLSNHPVISDLHKQSTTIHLHCSDCGKPLSRAGWLCDRCKGYINTCSICHHPVKGLYVWCQGCSHGGHLHHIKEWLATNKQCPAGCGHLCEFT